MALTDPHAPGATPLRPEEIRGLKHSVPNHGELNELEAANIVQGQEWALKARRTKLPDMLSDEYVCLLHKKLYGDVWKWAGKHRQHDTNIGVTYAMISRELRQLFDDAVYWHEHGTYPPDEFAIRLHHRLVKVHVFPNGNGRHARMLGDLLLLRGYKRDRLPWGGGALGSHDPKRCGYIAALQLSDQGDYGPLLEFCRSS